MEIRSVTAQKREHFRLQFPPFKRPKLYVDLRMFEILEVSEAGIKAAAGGGTTPPVGQIFEGIVVFTDGSREQVKGKLLRRDGDIFVMKLTQGISLQKMYDEHRKLMQQYAS